MEKNPEGKSVGRAASVILTISMGLLIVLGLSYLALEHKWAGNHWIRSYVKVVDQSGKPIRGIDALACVSHNKISFHPTIWGLNPTDTHLVWFKTDGQGEFSIRGVSGTSFGITVVGRDDESRYHLTPDFSDWPNTAEEGRTQENPLVIRAWDNRLDAPIVHWSTLVFQDWRGLCLPPNQFDYHWKTAEFLFHRKKTQNSDGSWSYSLEIHAKDGGLLETHDNPFVLAPENSIYYPIVTIPMRQSSAKKPEIVGSGRFYFWTRRPSGWLYGGVECLISNDFGNGDILVRYVINTKGNPNLIEGANQ
jgi:hypothetical protein